MKLSEDGAKFIACHEGIVTSMYYDAVDVPTVGIGHTAMAGPPNPLDWAGRQMPIKMVLKVFDIDLDKFEGHVRHYVKVEMETHEFDALVSLCYNIGPAGFGRSSVVRHLNNEDRNRAADSFLLWNKAGGNVLQGLVRRRKEERDLFLHADYGDLKCPIYGVTSSSRIDWRSVKVFDLKELDIAAIA